MSTSRQQNSQIRSLSCRESNNFSITSFRNPNPARTSNSDPSRFSNPFNKRMPDAVFLFQTSEWMQEHGDQFPNKKKKNEEEKEEEKTREVGFFRWTDFLLLLLLLRGRLWACVCEWGRPYALSLPSSSCSGVVTPFRIFLSWIHRNLSGPRLHLCVSRFRGAWCWH